MFNSVSNEFIGQFLLICIGFVLLYIQQRIKNKATKDDIKKLTEIAENVKSKLSLKTQHKLTIKKYELDAVLQYDKILSKWLLNLFRWNPYQYTIWNYNNIRKTKSSIQALKYETRYNDTNLEVLISDTAYLTLIDKVIAKAEEYEIFLETIISGMIEILGEYDEEYHTGGINTNNEEEVVVFDANVNQSLNKLSTTHKENFDRLRRESKELYFLYKKASNSIIYKIEENIDSAI